jgi:hypothetical protein
MALLNPGRRIPTALWACAAVMSAGLGSAQASVHESTATLPLLGVPYETPGGNCFPTAGICVAGGSFVLTSLAPPGLVPSGSNELITTNATDTVKLTTLTHMALPSLTLTGVIEQEVFDRTNPAFTGSWTVDLLSVNLTGMLGADTVTLVLNPADTSSGTTTITQGVTDFIATSFFDVFTELTLDIPGQPPLHTTASGTATAAGVPEPATLMLLAGPALLMSAVRRRRS